MYKLAHSAFNDIKRVTRNKVFMPNHKQTYVYLTSTIARHKTKRCRSQTQFNMNSTPTQEVTYLMVILIGGQQSPLGGAIANDVWAIMSHTASTIRPPTLVRYVVQKALN